MEYELTATPLSQVRDKQLQWLWKRFLPRRKIVLLDGDPAVGKSLVTLDLAARLSRGAALPDGTPSGRPHTVLLLAAGADLDRLIVVADYDGLPIQFPEQLMKLGELVRHHRPDLIIIDPIMAYLSLKVGAQNDQSVRQLLSALSVSAERADCTFLLVRHLRKAGSHKAVYRGSGSIAFIAAARTGLLAAPDPRAPDRCVLAVTKSNLADTPHSLGYRIRSKADGLPVVDWLGRVEVDANELNAMRDSVRPRERAITWLREELASGPRKSAEVLAAAVAAGIPERTVLRAKADLGIVSRQLGERSGNAWYWIDPAM